MPENFITFEDAEDDLLSAAAYIGERIKSADGRAQAMSAIVPRFLSHGNVDLAAELANSVDDPFTRDKLLTEVAEKCAEIDDDDYALQLAETVEEFGLRSQALERVALQKVRKGQIDKAIAIADGMSHPDLVLASAAARLAADGGKENAEELLSRVDFPAARVSALQAMAMTELAGGNKDECLALLGRAKDAALEIEHNEERIRNLCEIGNHYVEAGQNDLAIGAYDAARENAEQLDNIHRDPLIAAAVMGFLHAGGADLADRTLDLVSDKTQMANCLLAFAGHYWAKDEKDEALEALDEAYQILRSQRDFETRDSRSRIALFGSIAAQNAGFEKGERAVEIASAIQDDGERTAALSHIAAILALRRLDDEARQAISQISDDADRAFALIAMSDAKAKNGDRDDALALLDEASHLAEGVPQLTSRSWAQTELARRYTGYRADERASNMVSMCLATIAEIRDESSRAAAIAGLADVAGDGDIELTDSDKNVLASMLSPD